MPTRIVDFLSKTHEIPQAEIDILVNLVKPLVIKKGDFLYKEGKVPKHGAFVLQGILREYYTDSKGVDYVRRFAYEDWWMVDLYELLHEKPALCSVQAIEDTQLLTFSKNDCNVLMNECPIAAKVLREISSAEKYSLAKNEKQKKSVGAQENYESLLKNHPEIEKRIPLFHIASYLNIKPESLSRIRKQMSLSKSNK